MKIEIILGIIAFIINAVITYFTGIYTVWYWDVIMVLLLPITFILLLPIYIFFMFVCNLFMRGKKEVNKPKRFASFITKETYKLVLDIFRIKVHHTGLDLVPQNEKFLIISNHRSNWDPFPIGYFFPGNIADVTKPENLKMPVYGNFIKNCAFVPMPREDDFAAVKSIVRASKIIKEQSSSMVIFPEGTRNKTDDILLNFHAGSFKIAQRAKCPIVVVALTNTDTISMNLKRNDIYMDVVKVYTPEEVTSMNTVDLANETSELIKKQYLSRKEGK